MSSKQCSQCLVDREEFQFSSGQLKKRGKRVCTPCIDKTRTKGQTEQNTNATSSSSSKSAAHVRVSPPSAEHSSAERKILVEVGRLIELQHHLTEATNHQRTYDQVIEMHTKCAKELEGKFHELITLQKEESNRRKSERNTQSTKINATPDTNASVSTSSSSSSSSTTVVAAIPSEPSSSAPSQIQLDQLAAWLRVEAPGCKIGETWEFAPRVSDAEGTGVRAVRDMEADEHFLSIPRSAMMTSDALGLTSPIGQLIADQPLCKGLPSILLACCLMYERAIGERSRWHAYIQCLPKHVNLPLMWPVDQVRHLLQSSPLVVDVLSLKQKIMRQYSSLFAIFTTPATAKLVPTEFHFSWKRFLWAISIIMSRQNRIPSLAALSGKPVNSDTNTSAIALIPGWDFCNHRGHGFNATWFDTAQLASVSHTMEPVKKGEPIFLYYGARSNADLFLYAGFVDSHHRSDRMHLMISVDGSTLLPSPSASSTSASEDSHLKLKMMLLKKAGMGSSMPMQLPLNPNCTVPAPSSDDPEALAQSQQAKQNERVQWNALMHFARIAGLKTKEHMELALKHKGAFGNPLSPTFNFLPSLYPEHDLDAYTFLHDAVTSCIHAYTTTLEHDEAELLRDEAKRAADEHHIHEASVPHAESHHLHAPHRLALELRRAEKRMLKDAHIALLKLKEQQHAIINQK